MLEVMIIIAENLLCMLYNASTCSGNLGRRFLLYGVLSVLSGSNSTQAPATRPQAARPSTTLQLDGLNWTREIIVY